MVLQRASDIVPLCTIRSYSACYATSSWRALFCRDKRPAFGPVWVPRLQGTAALQVREDPWSFDQELEGAGRYKLRFAATTSGVWARMGSAAARDCSPPGQGRPIGALIKTWRASGPSAPRWSTASLFGRKGMTERAKNWEGEAVAPPGASRMPSKGTMFASITRASQATPLLIAEPQQNHRRAIV